MTTPDTGFGAPGASGRPSVRQRRAEHAPVDVTAVGERPSATYLSFNLGTASGKLMGTIMAGFSKKGAERRAIANAASCRLSNHAQTWPSTLARYVFRIATTESRIVGLDDTGVTIRRRHRASGQWRTTVPMVTSSCAACCSTYCRGSPWRTSLVAYDLMASSRAAVAPRIATLSSSLNPGVSRIKSICVLVQG